MSVSKTACRLKASASRPATRQAASVLESSTNSDGVPNGTRARGSFCTTTVRRSPIKRADGIHPSISSVVLVVGCRGSEISIWEITVRGPSARPVCQLRARTITVSPLINISWSYVSIPSHCRRSNEETVTGVRDRTST